MKGKNRGKTRISQVAHSYELRNRCKQKMYMQFDCVTPKVSEGAQKYLATRRQSCTAAQKTVPHGHVTAGQWNARPEWDQMQRLVPGPPTEFACGGGGGPSDRNESSMRRLTSSSGSKLAGRSCVSRFCSASSGRPLMSSWV